MLDTFPTIARLQLTMEQIMQGLQIHNNSGDNSAAILL
jgi:hypothetical protein